MITPGTPLLRVSNTSNPFKVAGAIAHALRACPQVTVQAIGGTSLNQALKAMIYAREFLEKDNLDLAVFPAFVDIEIEGNVKTVLRFLIERRSRDGTSG